MEACPKNTTNLTGIYKIYNVSWFLGINFMDAYDVYQ